MSLLGIRWAPLRIPLRRRLQTLAVTGWFLVLVFGAVWGCGILAYVLLYTQYWWVGIAYIVWIYFDSSHLTGVRWTHWARNWSWWKHFRDYFPITLVKTAELDPSKNYILGIYPHGVLSTGAFCAFGTNALDVDSLFPGLQSHILSLHQHFFMPLSREIGLSIGGCSASAEAIKNLLSTPGGGKMIALVVGGAAEALLSRNSEYRILINKRKGFCRIALEKGASIVPVFSFGEHIVYDQLENPEGSFLYRLQEFLRKHIGMAPVILRGRGWFQYSFGLLPHRSPVTVVVGAPIDVEKVSNPTREQVDELHDKYCKGLRDLYNSHQLKYHNGNDIPLVYQ